MQTYYSEVRIYYEGRVSGWVSPDAAPNCASWIRDGHGCLPSNEAEYAYSYNAARALRLWATLRRVQIQPLLIGAHRSQAGFCRLTDAPCGLATPHRRVVRGLRIIGGQYMAVRRLSLTPRSPWRPSPSTNLFGRHTFGRYPGGV